MRPMAKPVYRFAYEPEVLDAIVFRMKDDREVGTDRLKEIMTVIAKAGAASSSEQAHYRCVLQYVTRVAYDEPTKFDNIFIGDYESMTQCVMLPLDDDLIEDIVLSIPEMSSWRFTRNYNMNDIYNPRFYERPKPPKPVPRINKFGWDDNEISPRKRIFLEDDAQEEGRRWSELLEGYPFADKTPRENRRWIESEVIARMRALFPILYQADQTILQGKLTAALNAIADERNQVRISKGLTPKSMLPMFRTCFYQKHPGSIESSLVDVCNKFFILDRKEEEARKATKSVSINQSVGVNISEEGEAVDTYFTSMSTFINESPHYLDYAKDDIH